MARPRGADRGRTRIADRLPRARRAFPPLAHVRPLIQGGGTTDTDFMGQSGAAPPEPISGQAARVSDLGRIGPLERRPAGGGHV